MNEKYIRFDWAAKRILRDKANFDVLEGFLTVLIGEKITITEIVDDLMEGEDNYEKMNRFNVLALNSKNEPILIEIQTTRIAFFYERILLGVTDSKSRSDIFERVKKVYAISILYFEVGCGTDYLYQGQNTLVGVNTSDALIVNNRKKEALLPRNPVNISPEYFLIRVKEFDKVATTPLEEWIEYLKTGQIADDTSAPGLTEAKQKLQCDFMTVADYRAYERYMDNIRYENSIFQAALQDGRRMGRCVEEGRADGFAEGVAEGRAEERIKIVRRLHSHGVDNATIATVSGLTIEEVEKLIQEE
jgi:hypothetical protein